MVKKKAPAGPVPTQTIEEITQRLVSRGIPTQCIPTLRAATVSFSIGCKIPGLAGGECGLLRLARILPNTKYDRWGHRTLRAAMKDPKGNHTPAFTPALLVEYNKPIHGTVRLWKNGSATVLGAKSVADAKLLARKFCRMLQKLGLACNKLEDFRVNNLLGSSQIPGDLNDLEVDLDQLHHVIGEVDSTYEVELSQFLAWHPFEKSIGDQRANMVITVSKSGRLAYTGYKYYEDMLCALEKFWPSLITAGVCKLRTFVKLDPLAVALKAAKRKKSTKPKTKKAADSKPKKAQERKIAGEADERPSPKRVRVSSQSSSKKRKIAGKVAEPANPKRQRFVSDLHVISGCATSGDQAGQIVLDPYMHRLLHGTALAPF